VRWLALCLLTGCAVGPDFKKPDVPLNQAWSAAVNARFSTQGTDLLWWRSLNDVALNQLVEMAYQQNLPLQVAGLRILEARAQLGIAYGYFYPQNVAPIVSMSGNGLSSHAPNSASGDLAFGNYQFGFDAVWEIDLWGKYRRGVRAARASYAATVADYDGALVSLSAEVARIYIAIRMFETLIALANENVGVQEEGLRIAQSRFKNGATSELDVNQAATLLETTRTSIPELQIGLQQSHNALCTLLGRATGCAQVVLAQSAGIPKAPVQVGISVPAQLLRRRPDIRSAEFRAIAQCDRIGVAKADLFPRLELFGSLGTQTSTGGGLASGNSGFANLFGPGSLIYSFGFNLFLPLFNYPKILNNVRVEDARYQQTLLDYQQTVFRAAQEVEDGIVGFTREEEAVVFATNAVTAAQSAVKLALIQYREGAVDYQRVLDSERVLLQTQNTLARTQSSVVTNLVALYKALGGGWEYRAGEPVVADSVRKDMQQRTNWGRYFDKPPEPKRAPNHR
jgi:NodT family efflux transporter outer membrane factor (OMF) lipoprotein